MKQFRLLFLLVLSLTLLLATACAGAESTAANEQVGVESADDDHDDSVDDHSEGEDDHDEADDGHSAAAHVEPPEEFASLKNEFAGDHEAIEAGEETYNTLCVTCHGEEGKGDGPGAAELDPKPADLSDSAMMSDLSDGYLFWRVTKGGAMEPFNSAMPTWEAGLTEEQRWQVISYIRTLSGTSGSMADDHAEDDEHDD
jgi:mono/diheme cytochrome c family protein